METASTMENRDNQFKEHRQALAALYAFKNKPSGEKPSLQEVDAWRLGKLPEKRAAEVLSYIANDPDYYEQWRDLQEAEQWLVDDALADDALSVDSLDQPAPLIKRFSDWLASLIVMPVTRVSLAFALVAIVVTPLLLPTGATTGVLLETAYGLYGDASPNFAAPNVFKTKGLDNLLGDAVARDDREQYHLKIGFRRFIEKMRWSNDKSWDAWLDTLPKKTLKCDKAPSVEKCENSTLYYVNLGQWSLLTFNACQAGQQGDGGSSDDDFWQNQSDAAKQLMLDSSKVDKPPQEGLKITLINGDKAELCDLSSKIVSDTLPGAR